MKEWNKPSMQVVFLDPLATDDIVGCSQQDPAAQVRLHNTQNGDPIFGEGNNEW